MTTNERCMMNCLVFRSVGASDRVGSGRLPFCCRASCLLVSMSCRVAARFLGRLPVLLAASRGLCWVRGSRPSVRITCQKQDRFVGDFREDCGGRMVSCLPLSLCCVPASPLRAAEATQSPTWAGEDTGRDHCPASSGTPEGGGGHTETEIRKC